jgi:mono/diheme cytochrome c family protein
MRKLLKWVAGIVGVLVLAALALYALAYFRSEAAMKRHFALSDPPLEMPRDPATVTRGAHLFATRGCGDCHGQDAAGKEVFDAGPVARIVAPNITTGGRLKGATPEQVAGAIRHGVAADGRPLVFMPAEDFHEMSDGDVAAVIAFLQQLPPSDNLPPPLEVRPVGRIMWLLGQFPLLPAEKIDHSPRARSAPPIAADAAYGKYVAQGCTGCHGKDFAGQHVPGTPPAFPDAQNLTPAALGSWSEADFLAAIRTGKRPDGSAIDPFMPWKTYAQMSDVELKALWAYLRTLPPVESKKKR